MSREVQVVVLALLGAATLRISLSDAFLSYVREPMRPLLIVAGVLLLALAAWSAWRVTDASVQGRDHDADGAEVNAAHAHHGPRLAWLLLLPVLAIFLVAPPPLGVEAAARDSGVVAAEPQAWPDLPEGDPVEITLYEYALRASTEEGRVTVEDRRLLLVGFSSPSSDGQWYLTRFVAACCAADAAAVKVRIAGQPNPGDGRWVEVVGRFAAAVDDGAGLPVLDAESVLPIDQPRLPYL